MSASRKLLRGLSFSVEPRELHPRHFGNTEAPSGDTEAAIPNDHARPHGRHQQHRGIRPLFVRVLRFPLIRGNVGQVGESGAVTEQNATSVNRKTSCGGRGSETCVRRTSPRTSGGRVLGLGRVPYRGWRWPYAVKALLGDARARKWYSATQLRWPQ